MHRIAFLCTNFVLQKQSLPSTETFSWCERSLVERTFAYTVCVRYTGSTAPCVYAAAICDAIVRNRLARARYSSYDFAVACDSESCTFEREPDREPKWSPDLQAGLIRILSLS